MNVHVIAACTATAGAAPVSASTPDGMSMASTGAAAALTAAMAAAAEAELLEDLEFVAWMMAMEDERATPPNG